MLIIARPSATKETVKRNVDALGPGYERFRDEMFGPLWQVALEYVIDPVGMVAQAAKETAWGRYPGKAKPWSYNTCGLKVTAEAVAEVMRLVGTTDHNHTLVHAQFASFWDGAEAHAQHLRAYAGVPITQRLRDPRYESVVKRADHWYQLTVWSESTTYGTELEAIMKRLSA